MSHFTVPRARVARWILGSLSLLLASADADAQAKKQDPKDTPKRVEKQDPSAAADCLDEFSGKTVKDRKTGMKLLMERSKKVPKVGTLAPDFTLKVRGSDKRVKLSSFRGKRPVVLVFGSYT